MRDVSQYVLDGERLISVTEVLDAAGLVDLSGIPPENLKRARDRGQEVHEWLALEDQGFLEGEQPTEDIAGYIEAYHRFKRESGFIPELIEHPVINPIYRYAGTLDRAGPLNGARGLFELKAVARVGPETALQTMGYALCLEHPHKRYGLQLRPDGTYRLQPYPLRGRTDQMDRDDWYAAVRMAYWKLTYMGETLE